MAINGIQSVGDDQRWVEEVEREVKDLRRLVQILQSQLNARSR